MSFFRGLFNTSEEPEDEKSTTQEIVVSSEGETAPAQPAADLGVTRQLPVEAIIEQQNAHLTFGQTSDTGMMHSDNQDSAFAFAFTSESVDDLPQFGLFIVADGMGGHEGGERASALAMKSVSEGLLKDVFTPILEGNGMDDVPPVTEVLVSALENANKEIHGNIPEGGGTTCTTAVIMGQRVFLGHVGDSRAYLLAKGTFEQITRDHSLAQRLYEVGQLTKEEIPGYERGNELYRALGINESVEVDIITRSLPLNCKLLLCSDGLWNKVSDEVIHKYLEDTIEPQVLTDKLVALANTNGGDDNITVVVVALN